MTFWNELELTRRLAHANWMAAIPVRMYLNERATGDPAREWLGSWAQRYFIGENLRVLVLGCGEGWLERGIAQWPFVAHIDAVDVAANAVARADEIAREQGLTQIRYDVVDLNHATLAPHAYDVIVAHAVLHHVEDLEHAYAQIAGALRPHGTLVVNEYVGPNRFQFSDGVLTLMNELFATLPAHLRRGAMQDVVYERRERPTIEQMLSNDPTEAVRSEELLAFTAQQFEIIERRDIGGTVLQHLLYDIVHNFRWEDPRERSILELLCTIEAAHVDAGTLDSDFVLLAARHKTAPRPKLRTDLPPRPEAANDVDPDPLLSRPRRERTAAERQVRGGFLRKHHLRALRIALASTQESRRNLFNEASALRERLRFATAAVTPRDWLLSRYAAYGDDPTIKALLQQF